jgi:hypothetical protein
MLAFYYDTEYSEFVLSFVKAGWFLHMWYPPFGDLTHRVFKVPYPRLHLTTQTGSSAASMRLETGPLVVVFGRKGVNRESET